MCFKIKTMKNYHFISHSCKHGKTKRDKLIDNRLRYLSLSTGYFDTFFGFLINWNTTIQVITTPEEMSQKIKHVCATEVLVFRFIEVQIIKASYQVTLNTKQLKKDIEQFRWLLSEIPKKPPIAQSFAGKDETHKIAASLKWNSVIVVFSKIYKTFQNSYFSERNLGNASTEAATWGAL